jgi:serine phosphatase RsbU (regulator of sigma subunit)
MSSLLEFRLGVSKVPKWGVSESGDTLEVVERPHGGFSVVLVDGQGSGRAAKTLSNMVAGKAIALLKEGAREDAVAMAANDYLYAYRHGQVLCTLNITSLDLRTRTILLARNNPAPVVVVHQGMLRVLTDASVPIGMQPNVAPLMMQFPLEPDTYVVVVSDGVSNAGRGRFVLGDVVRRTLEPEVWAAADTILRAAVDADEGRAHDDMTVMVMAVVVTEQVTQARRLSMSIPLYWHEG